MACIFCGSVEPLLDVLDHDLIVAPVRTKGWRDCARTDPADYWPSDLQRTWRPAQVSFAPHSDAS